MGCHLRRDPDAPSLGLPDEGDTGGGGQPLNVDPAPRHVGQGQITSHADGLGHRWGASQAETRGHDPLVHHPALGQIHVFRVGEDGHVERLGVLEGQTQQGAGPNGPAAVGKGDGARVDDLTELDERLTLGAHRNGGDRIDPGRGGPAPLRGHEAHTGGVVGYGIGNGHGAHRPEPSCHRCPGTRGDRLPMLVPRLAQVRVEVDEGRCHHQTGRIDDLGPFCFQSLPYLLHHALGQHDVEDLIESGRRIHHPSPPQDHRRLTQASPWALADSARSGAPPASRYSTAMRMATPLVTC